jgi:hypothetical protein
VCGFTHRVSGLRTDPTREGVQSTGWPPGSAGRPYFGVYTEDYAVAALFHALGPDRAALLPGWCGDFLLTSAEVRASLPQVEAAFAFTEQERAAAEAAVWLDDRDDEPVLAGPLRCWRDAAAAGLGLCGAAIHVY